MVEVEDDGSIWMDMSSLNYCQGGLTMTSEKFHRVFGGPPRRPESPITEREMDIAASIQKVTEDVMLNAARHVHAQTGLPNLCLAGGVALNCVANGRIQREDRSRRSGCSRLRRCRRSVGCGTACGTSFSTSRAGPRPMTA